MTSHSDRPGDNDNAPALPDKQLRQQHTPSAIAVRLQPSKARRAAAMARSTSAAVPREMLAKGNSLAGLITSKSCGVCGGTQAPSM